MISLCYMQKSNVICVMIRGYPEALQPFWQEPLCSLLRLPPQSRLWHLSWMPQQPEMLRWFFSLFFFFALIMTQGHAFCCFFELFFEAKHWTEFSSKEALSLTGEYWKEKLDNRNSISIVILIFFFILKHLSKMFCVWDIKMFCLILMLLPFF